ncbi:MAG: hypothetical protein PUB18_00740 [bacterium]|nr:hypothetical protein [bacterium]
MLSSSNQTKKVPIDVNVLTGKEELNTSALTGESNSELVQQGNIVLSRSIDINGMMEVKVTCKYENSTVNKIL